MGLQENDDESVMLLEVHHEVAEEEPIEQVFSQEPEDINATTIHRIEVQEGFGETAKFGRDRTSKS